MLCIIVLIYFFIASDFKNNCDHFRKCILLKIYIPEEPLEAFTLQSLRLFCDSFFFSINFLLTTIFNQTICFNEMHMYYIRNLFKKFFYDTLFIVVYVLCVHRKKDLYIRNNIYDIIINFYLYVHILILCPTCRDI